MAAHASAPTLPAHSRALVVGESITDVVVSNGAAVDHAGGSPLNVSCGAARLGLPATLATHIGDDERGTALAKHVRSSGATMLLAPAVGARSATAMTTIDEEGRAVYDFDIDWSLPAIRLSDFVDPECFSLVHFGSIGAFLEPGASSAEAIVASMRDRAVITYDPNVRPQLLPPLGQTHAAIERHLALADVAKASDEDLEWLYPGNSIEGTAASWLEHGPKIVVVTMGERGAYVASRSGVSTYVPGIATSVADTIGAGDSFTAALMTALAVEGFDGPSGRAKLTELDDENLRRMTTFAAQCAAITVSRPGAHPPTMDEWQAWLAARS